MLDGTTQRYELKWTEVDSQLATKQKWVDLAGHR